MDENVKEKEIIYEITPKFNFIYELGMPTGKKLKSTIMLLTIFLIGYVIFAINKDNISINKINGIDFKSVLNVVLLIAIAFSIVKLIIHIILQIMQYKNIKYTFYNDHMTYEDSFLNQHKKI